MERERERGEGERREERETKKEKEGYVGNGLGTRVMESDGLSLNTTSYNNKKQSLEEITSFCLISSF